MILFNWRRETDHRYRNPKYEDYYIELHDGWIGTLFDGNGKVFDITSRVTNRKYVRKCAVMWMRNHPTLDDIPDELEDKKWIVFVGDEGTLRHHDEKFIYSTPFRSIAYSEGISDAVDQGYDIGDVGTVRSH